MQYDSIRGRLCNERRQFADVSGDYVCESNDRSALFLKLEINKIWSVAKDCIQKLNKSSIFKIKASRPCQQLTMPTEEKIVNNAFSEEQLFGITQDFLRSAMLNAT